MPETVIFTIRGDPVGKPRMTRRDKWAKRDCVMRYRAWADSARDQAPKNLPLEPLCVSLLAFFKMPASWSEKKKREMAGQLHRQKPDADNILKCIDGLWKQDKGIAIARIEKRWDDGRGARTIVSVN